MIALACALPILAGVAVLALPRLGHAALCWLTAATAGVSAAVLGLAWAAGSVVDLSWLPSLGLRLHLALDGIGGPLALLAAGVTAAAAIASVRQPPVGGSPATFAACLLLTLGGAVTAFAARDAVLFVIAFEAVLVPVWLLITRFGDDRHPAATRAAGTRFVLYTGLGSTLLLLGVLALVTASGTADLGELAARRGAGLDRPTQTLIAALLTAGLAVKVPVWPLHSWLPPAHTAAPTAGSVLLAAVLLKLGTYGLVRLPLAAVPDGFARLAPVLAVCGVVGIIWGGLVCLVEPELKRLIAWSSVAHMGFVMLGLATGTATGVAAGLYGNLAHGLVSALLFVLDRKSVV